MVRKSGAFDLNRCTVRQLVQLSGIPLDNARKLVRFRERQRRAARKMEEQRQARLQRTRVLREELSEQAQPRRSGRRRKPSPAAEVSEEGQPSVMAKRSSRRRTQDTGPPEQQVLRNNGADEEPQLSQKNSDDTPRELGTEQETMQIISQRRNSSSLRTVDPASHAMIVIKIKCPQAKVLRDQGTNTVISSDRLPSQDVMCVPIKQSPSMKEQTEQQRLLHQTANQPPPQQDQAFVSEDPATAGSSHLQAPGPLQYPPQHGVSNQDSPAVDPPQQSSLDDGMTQLVSDSGCRICGKQTMNHSHSPSQSTGRSGLERNLQLLEDQRWCRRTEEMQENSRGPEDQCAVS